MENMNLLEIKNRLVMLPVLTERLRKLNSRISEAESEVSTLLRKYEAESLDVDQIKKESLSASILKLFGKYEGRVDKEVREMLEAKTEYDAAVHRVNELRKEKGELNPRISDLIKDRDVLESELKRREALLKSKISSVVAAEFNKLEAEQEHLLKQAIETDEAVEAANRAKRTAERAIGYLDKAEGWASYDIWFKSGIISHMAKYDHIDNAQAEFDRLNSQMQDLQKELEDIDIAGDFQPIGVDSGTRAIDFWFDNIFTDLNVRNKIRDDRDRIKCIYGKLEGAIGRLGELKTEIEKRINIIDNKKNELIISFEG